MHFVEPSWHVTVEQNKPKPQYQQQKTIFSHRVTEDSEHKPEMYEHENEIL